jgi:hypothetical protein
MVIRKGTSELYNFNNGGCPTHLLFYSLVF